MQGLINRHEWVSGPLCVCDKHKAEQRLHSHRPCQQKQVAPTGFAFLGAHYLVPRLWLRSYNQLSSSHCKANFDNRNSPFVTKKMRSFRSLTADRRPLEEFKARGFRSMPGKVSASSSNIPLHVFEWSQGSPNGTEISGLCSVQELESRSQGTVRVV